MSVIGLFGQSERQVALAPNIDTATGSSDEDFEAGLKYDHEAPLDQANIVTSQSASGALHYPVIDLDVPAVLVPSTTSGHSHLYIGRGISWGKYVKVLEALAAAGIVEKGYVNASKRRGFTSVRLPWVKKKAVKFL